MSRVIKFREWDVQNKRYHYWGVGLMGVGTFTSKINPMFQDQQFTGLKDMNGKEIYEGDIIEYRQSLFNVRPENWPTKTKVVEWNSLRGSWNIYETAAGEDNIKVVGNIYQMPI